jgi:hypothetical protein
LKRDEILKLNDENAQNDNISRLTEQNLLKNEASIAEEKKKPQSKVNK